MNADPIEIFRATWGTYQKLVAGNHMFHRELAGAVRDFVASLPAPLAVLDLGCGDACLIPEILKPEQVAGYCGCDLCQWALDLAAGNMAPFGNRAELHCADMLSMLQDAPGRHFDLVYSSFAMHHLPFESKRDFFAGCARVLREDGCLVLVDVMREDGQSREEYLDVAAGEISTQWMALAPAERERVIGHVTTCDFPEPASTLAMLAQEAGLERSRRLGKHTWHEAWCFRAQGAVPG